MIPAKLLAFVEGGVLTDIIAVDDLGAATQPEYLLIDWDDLGGGDVEDVEAKLEELDAVIAHIQKYNQEVPEEFTRVHKEMEALRNRLQ